MALTKPIWMREYTAASTVGGLIKVTQGGATLYQTLETLAGSINTNDCANQMVVHDGNLYAPYCGKASATLGWVTWNHTLGRPEVGPNLSATTRGGMTVGEYFLFFGGTVIRRMSSPRNAGPDFVGVTSPTVTAAAYDVILFNNTVYGTTAGSAGVWAWASPFTGDNSQVGSGLYIQRFAVFQGELYGVDVRATGTPTLYKLSGGVFTSVGALGLSEQAYIAARYGATAAFFEYNDKLWLIVAYTNSGSYGYRCYYVNTSTGAATEDNTYNPWTATASSTSTSIFEVIDDTGSSRQVFLCAHNRNVGGWEVREFSDSATWSLIASGAHGVINSGVIWDTDATSCHIISGSDSSPSSYASIVHRVTDLDGNSTVDVDIRYVDPAGNQDPPPTACTNKSGQGEGATGLASKPSGVSALTDLSDDFNDATLDEDLWEVVTPSVRGTTTPLDYGFENSVGGDKWEIAESDNGGGQTGIWFGGTATFDGVAYCGVGIRSLWRMSGAFTVDVTIGNLAALVASTTGLLGVWIYVKIGFNRGFAIKVWRYGVGDVRATGYVFNLNAATTTKNGSTTTIADGDVFRIARNGSGNWTLTYDPGGGGEEDLTPTSPPVNYTENAEIILCGLSDSTSNWANASPGPGWQDIDVSGAGSLGNYQGYVEHTFCWDHITDLGTGYNNSPALYGGTT